MSNEPDLPDPHLQALCEGLELPLAHWLEKPPEALRLIGAAIADQAKAGAQPAPSRSEKLTAAGFTRRPSGKTAGGLMLEDEVELLAKDGPAGYRFICRKPGTVSTFVSIAPEGSEHWPWDGPGREGGWHTVERIPLIDAGPPEVIWRAATSANIGAETQGEAIKSDKESE